MNKTIYFHHFGLVNPGVLEQRHPADRRADHRGLEVELASSRYRP
jgi:hypothetical protein